MIVKMTMPIATLLVKAEMWEQGIPRTADAQDLIRKAAEALMKSKPELRL